jgi:outer membrane autotransporter protein
MELRGNTALLYGAYYPTPNSYLDATLLYGRNKYTTVRKFDFAISGILDTTTANTSGSQRGISLGAGFTMPHGRWSYGPYARLDYAKLKIDGFTEEGGSNLNEDGTSNNLTVHSQSVESLLMRLGGQVSYAVGVGWGVLVPYGFLEWAHQFRDDRTSKIVASMRDVPSDATMVIHTTPVDKNYGNLGVGLAAHFGVGRSALLYYQTEVGHQGQRANQITAELRLEF